MSVAASLLPELDHEMANTRRVLERIPDDQLELRPHQRSWTLRQLATHLANLPIWLGEAMRRDELDIAPPGEAPPTPPPPIQSRDEALARFDANLAASRALLAEASDERLLGTWTFKHGGRVIFVLPRVAVFRGFAMNHTIHHRGQMTVYLRLAGAKVPSLYGASADENPFA
jgi:uncharacterized damage-inducible protein DinB